MDIANGAGILDPAVIDEIAAEVWPEPRDADELHDALLTMVALPPASEWEAWFDELRADGRASVFHRGGRPFWIATERAHLETDALATVRGWMECLGPATASAIAERLALPLDDVRIALAQLESEGIALQGRYRSQDGEIEWCNRRILARIHRATLGRLRREIEPVSAAQFYEFLLKWQHLAPGSQLHGVDGVLQIVRQLQGFEIPASGWESQALRRRMAEYEPEDLDQLCLSGEVMWARLSPHPALGATQGKVRATRIAPVSLFLREDADWLASPGFLEDTAALSHAAREAYEALRTRGASFFADLVRATRRLPSEVEDALWELTAAGLVTADGFENLRALIDPKRRRGEGRGRTKRPRHSPGRWALLQPQRTTAEHRRTRAQIRRGSCCCDGAFYFATCWRAKPSRRRGATCCPSCDAWKRKVKSAEAASSRASRASSTRVRKPSRSCAPFAANPQTPRHPSTWRQPTRSTWPASSFRVRESVQLRCR